MQSDEKWREHCLGYSSEKEALEAMAEVVRDIASAKDLTSCRRVELMTAARFLVSSRWLKEEVDD